MNTYKHNGFTLIELMVGLLVLAITMAYAVPGFKSSIRTNRTAALSNNLVSAINLTRSEAVSRGMSVSLCASSNQQTCTGSNWSAGWIVFADINANGAFNDNGNASLCQIDGSSQLTEDCLLKVWHEAKGGISISGNVNAIQYMDSGFPSGTAIFNIVVPECRGNQNISVSVNAIGRPSSANVVCS